MAAGCGSGSGDAPAEYRLLCAERQSCLGDSAFSEEYGSVDACARGIVDKVEEGGEACEAARRDEVVCRFKNFQCTDGEETLTSTCQAKRSNKISTCSDGGTYEEAKPEHFRDYCKLLEICQGESSFDGEYGDLAGCVDEYEQIYSNFSGDCELDASRALYCEIENFQCTNGQNELPDECSEEAQEFSEECDL
jgi:hypothetical protein